MKKIFVQILLILFAFSTISAQNKPFSIISEIKKQLNYADIQIVIQAQKRISLGDSLRSLANKLEQQAISYKNKAASEHWFRGRRDLKKYQQLHQKALVYYISSSINYGLGNKKLYNVYKQNLTKLYPKIPKDKITEFNNLIKQANNSYEKAKQLRRKGINAPNDDIKFKYYKQAEQLEAEAVELQTEAYSLYFNSRKNKTQKQKPTSSPPITQPQTTVTQTTSNTTPTQTYTQPPHPAATSPNIYFRVQVAASKVPLPISKLRKIYPGKIYYEFDPYDKMYKYLTLQKFSTYQQAYNFKHKINVPGAFIVAYKNGKRVRNIKTVVPNWP